MRTKGKFPSMIEIVFENRNKSYGAFELRSKYNQRLFYSFSITLFALLILILISLIQNKKTSAPLAIPIVDILDLSKNFTAEQVQQIQIKQTETGLPSPKLKQTESFVFVADSTHTSEFTDTTFTDVSDTQDNQNTVAGLGNTTDTIHTSGISQPGAATLGLAAVEKVPEFPGGIEKFYKFLINNIRYTREAREAGVNARLYVSFVIDQEGMLGEIEIMNTVGFGLESEAQRILNNSPRWSPGFFSNKPVKTKMVLPVSFSIFQ